MSAISYTAVDRGELATGHTSGTVYVFDVDLNKWDRAASRKKNDEVSLSGVRETLLHRVDRIVQVSTVPIKDEGIIESMREFLDSVLGNETFTIDLRGTASVPSTSVVATLEGNPSEQRQGRSDTYIFSFKIRL